MPRIHQLFPSFLQCLWLCERVLQSYCSTSFASTFDEICLFECNVLDKCLFHQVHDVLGGGGEGK